MPSLPTGTVTFLFTDIEGSTRLLQQLGDRYADVLATHHRLLRTAIQGAQGQVVDTQGDAVFAAFPRARDALLAAIAAQRAVKTHPWPDGIALKVRFGLHTGEPLTGETGYVGMDVHRAARIAAAGHGGQILVSDVTHGLVSKDLPEGVNLRDLGEYRLKDLAYPYRLFQAVVADLPNDFPPLKTLSVLPNNLPVQLTSFIGREREIVEVKTMVTTAHLVTLTGPGGSGKTRLALQGGADLLEQFRDGVWLVELAAVTDPALVPRTLASALRMREQPGRMLTETLVDTLQPKSLLLLLDSCEHLLAACARLADILLRACPDLRILATSREGLGIAGERLHPVPTLAVPDLERLPSVQDLAGYEAVRLFTERAIAVVPSFRLTAQNARPIAQICHHLDGIPLAIELAAVWVKTLALDQIVVRLGERFRLLTGGSRTALPRHQTLQAAMDWSYGLLSEKERVVLQRLSVFARGCTLEAAEAVCSGDGVGLTEVLDLLAQLVGKSLLLAETRPGGVRYRLLETIRQYASQKLIASGEGAEVHKKHRDWYLDLAERTELKRWGPDQAVGLEQLENEHDNLRGALEWSRRSGGAEESLRLTSALGWFWHIRGYHGEARLHLEAALSVSGRSRTPSRARALFWAGRLAVHQQDHAAARASYNESLAIFRELGSKLDVAVALDDLGTFAHSQGSSDEARRYLEESLAIFRALDHKEGVGWTLRHLSAGARDRGDYSEARSLSEQSLVTFRELGSKRGMAYVLGDLGILVRDQGDYGVSRALHEESLAIFRELGDKEGNGRELAHLGRLAHRRGDYASAHSFCEESLRVFQEVGVRADIAFARAELGRLAYDQGDCATARVFYQESLTVFREMGHKRGLSWLLAYWGELAQVEADYATARSSLEESLTLFREMGAKQAIAERLNALGNLARLQGDIDRATALHREALGLSREVGAERNIADTLAGFAGVAFERKEWRRAVRLYGAARGLFEANAGPLTARERSKYDCDLRELRNAIGDSAFDEALSEGRAMTLEQALEYALVPGAS